MNSPSLDQPQQPAGVTFRAIVLGLVLIPANCMWVELSEFMWYSACPTTVSLYSNVVFIFCLIILCNSLVKKVRVCWALRPPELLVIYIMLAISNSMAGHDMMQVLVPSMSHLHHFGPIERRYERIIELVPSWLIVSDQHALESAYIGQESIYRAANILPWLGPLAWWFAFVMALCAVLWGLNLVFRKQWTENERLAYPIIQVPMLLANEAGALVRSRAFWIAFSIAAGIDLLNGLHVLFPLLPRIPVVQVLNLQSLFSNRPWRDMWPAWVSFYPFIIGLCFFMPLDLAFSCWFFFLFWQMQRVLASYFGIHGMPGFPFVAEQMVGGYYAIALMALWITRKHLRRLLRLLLGQRVERETPWDRLEARLAFLLIVGGAAFLYYFCRRAQMKPVIIGVFFVMYYLISIAIARMRAELGPPTHDLYPIGPHRQLVGVLGAPYLRTAYPNDLAMFGLLNFFNRVYRNHPMPQGIEGFRIAERMKMDNFRLLIAMLLAIAVGILSAFWALLWILNKYGATAQVSSLGEYLSRETWDTVDAWFNNPVRRQNGPAFAIGIGLLCALGLAFLRMNLHWWPLHPVGYAISGSWTMTWFWLCVFIAWLVKMVILKYGGAKAYKPAVPFFVGLILGDFAMGSFWNLYGIVMETDTYHFWPY